MMIKVKKNKIICSGGVQKDEKCSSFFVSK